VLGVKLKPVAPTWPLPSRVRGLLAAVGEPEHALFENQSIVTLPVGVGLPAGALGSGDTVTESCTVVPTATVVTAVSLLLRTWVEVSEGSCCTIVLPPMVAN
jgi:hypothetical protein